MERRRRQNTDSREAQPVIVGDGPAIGRSADGSTHASASDERIARRAYQRFEERGGEHGRDLEDWLEAERELMSSSNGND